MEESDMTSPQVPLDVKEGDVKIEEMSDEEEPSSSNAFAVSDIVKKEDADSSSDDESCGAEGAVNGSRIVQPQHKCKYSTEISCCKHELSELVKQEEGKGVPFKCLDCEETFTTDCGQYSHVMKKHCEHENKTARGYRCSICSVTRKNWRLLAGHMIENHDIRYSQMLIPSPSLRKGLMTILLKKKDAQEPVNVEVGLSENEQFPCSNCHQSFFFKHDLMDHVQEKHKNYKYRCSKCDDRFRNNYRLTKHLLEAHNLEVFLKCVLCRKTCRSDIGLYSHLLTKHVPEVRYRMHKNMDMTCSICGILEKGGLRLAKHMMRQHGVKVHQLSLPSWTSDGVNLTIKVLNCQGTEAQITVLCHDAQHASGTSINQELSNQNIILCQKPKPKHNIVSGESKSEYCSICDRYFATESGFYYHNLAKHCEKVFRSGDMVCSICESFSCKGAHRLSKHMVNEHQLRFGMLSSPCQSFTHPGKNTILVQTIGE